MKEKSKEKMLIKFFGKSLKVSDVETFDSF